MKITKQFVKDNLKEINKLLEELKKEPVIHSIPAKKLEWGACFGETMTWEDAKIWCKKQGAGWRLPTQMELLQAFEDKISGFQSPTYWSSTEGGTHAAWFVNFSNGGSLITTKDYYYSVRCVKGQ